MSGKTTSPLGKGLKALLPVSFMENGIDLDSEERTDKGRTSLFQCPIDFISANPYQPRKEVETAALDQLAASIREKGVLQPLLVRQVDENRYELIAGERRLRAAKMAGLEKVPVIERDIALSDRLEIALIENIQRENLNPIDEAEAYAKLMDEFGLTQESIAKRVGKNRSTIANSVRILQLPVEVQEDVAYGRISSGHARVLIGLGDESIIIGVKDAIIAQGLSVRETEELVRSIRGGDSSEEKKKESSLPPSPAIPKEYCASLTTNLTEYLGSKAKIVQKGEKGKIEISYSSQEDLDRLLARIMTRETGH